MKGSVHERFWAKVDKRGPDECWPWIAGCNQYGYGMFTISMGHPKVAHRWAWEDANGPIPDDHDVGHVCHDEDAICPGGVTCPHRKCVNPAHLQPMSRRKNLLAGKTLPARESKITHCPQGHEYTPANTYRWAKKPRMRYCRTCLRDRNRERYWRNKAR